MAIYTSTQNGTWDDPATWGETVDFPIDGDTANVDHLVTLDSDEACDDVTVSNGAELDISTYTLTVDANVTYATVIEAGGKLTVGDSTTAGSSGLVTHGLNFESTGGSDARNLVSGSIIEITGGTYRCAEDVTDPSVENGWIIFSGDANWNDYNYLNRWQGWEIEDGVTVVCTGDVFTSNWLPSNTTVTLNGTLDINGQTFSCGIDGTLNIGANADITGTGTLRLWISTGVTINNSKTSAYSFTGEHRGGMNSGQSARRNWPGDWSNASLYRVWDIGSGTRSFQFYDSITVSDFRVDGDAGTDNLAIDNSTGNGSITCTGNWESNFNGNTVNWTKGTGVITLTGSSGTQTIAMNGHSVEDIVIDASGATKQFTETVTTESLTVTAGTINHNGQTFTTGGNYLISAGALNTASGLNGASITVGGNYEVNGQLGSLLDLAAGSSWTLNITGTAVAKYVDVAYSNASGGTQVKAISSTDSTNNSNWLFVWSHLIMGVLPVSTSKVKRVDQEDINKVMSIDI